MGYERITKRQALLGTGVLGPQSVLQYKDVTLTNAQVLALRATPITLVPAQGAGKLALFSHAVLVLSAASGAYTETADNLAVRQTNGSGVIVSDTIETTGFIDQAAVKATTARAKLDQIGLVENAALVLHNTGDGEFGGGNAATTLKIRVFYTVQKLGWGTLA